MGSQRNALTAFSPRGKSAGTHRTGGWVGNPISGLEWCGEEHPPRLEP
jgi:hypothetical protein